MNIENILNNDDYKLIFLKAILLGINYGKSNNINYYINNIEEEINKINDKKINNNDKKSNNNIKIKNNLIEKNENTLIQLENQKNYIISLIQKLSLNNYGYNYSRINLLKNNLNLINIEIEKNKLILKKNKAILENQEKNKAILENQLLLKNKAILENQVLLKNQERNFKKNDKKENLVGELEKTLGNLSTMLI